MSYFMYDERISMSDIGLANSIKDKLERNALLEGSDIFKRNATMEQIRKKQEYNDDKLEYYTEDRCMFFESHMPTMISLYSRIINKKSKSISDYKNED